MPDANTPTADTPDADTPDASADTWAVGADHAYYQAWVPFQSGALVPSDGVFGSTMESGNYKTTYGLRSPFTSRPMGTFLHLGAIDPEMADPTRITGTTANDTLKRDAYIRANNLAGQVSQFVDDTRKRSKDATDPGARQNESLLLPTKGGWRDHTDGNRISTTAGDKVEVIGGNSVLVILGRPTKDNNLDPDTWAAGDGATNTHQVESSGWMGYENDGAPGHVEEVRWVDDAFGGTWMVREKTYANDTVSIGSGSVRESFVGPSVELSSGNSISYHGRIRDIPDALKGNADFNPATVMRDEQQQKDTFPYSVDMTSAEDFITSVKNNAIATFNDPDIPQTVTEYARLDSVTSDTLVTGDVTETNTVSGTVTESLTADHVASTTAIRLTKSEVETVGGNLASVTAVGGMMEEVTVVGAASVSATVGASKADISIFGAQAGIELTLDSFTLFIGVGKQEIDLCPFVYDYGSDKLEFSAVATITAATSITVSCPTVDIQGLVQLGGPPVAVAVGAAPLVAAAPAAQAAPAAAPVAAAPAVAAPAAFVPL